jgi:Holliday junction resolvase RusA-like endonuclease
MANGLERSFGENSLKVESVSWTARFVPPPSWSRKRRDAAIGKTHRSKPDRDNIDKAVLDCLFPNGKGGDSGIGPGYLDKVWSWEPGLDVTIVYLD